MSKENENYLNKIKENFYKISTENNEIKEEYQNCFKRYNVPSLSLANEYELFKNIYGYMKDIVQNIDVLETLEEHITKSIYEKQNELISIINQINSDYINKDGDPQNKLINLKTRYQEKIKESFEYFYDFYQFKFLLLKLLKNTTQEILEKAKLQLDEMQKKNEKADEIIKNIEIASGKQGISKFAEIYNKQSIKHRKLATVFGCIIFVTLIITGIVLFLLMSPFYKENIENLSSNIFLHFSARIAVLSILSIIIYQLFKIFNANLHLYVINNHKKNALQTFQVFVNSGESSEEIKNAILLMTTKSIFELNQTGFVKDQKEEGDFNYFESFLKKQN